MAQLAGALRHRQFGVLVTTAAVARQAYEEVREDGHPIVFMSGKDIADVLVDNGYSDLRRLREFLSAEFPTSEVN